MILRAAKAGGAQEMTKQVAGDSKAQLPLSVAVPNRTEKGQKRSHSKPSPDVDFSLLRDFKAG